MTLSIDDFRLSIVRSGVLRCAGPLGPDSSIVDRQSTIDNFSEELG